MVKILWGLGNGKFRLKAKERFFLVSILQICLFGMYRLNYLFVENEKKIVKCKNGRRLFDKNLKLHWRLS